MVHIVSCRKCTTTTLLAALFEDFLVVLNYQGDEVLEEFKVLQRRLPRILIDFI